MHNYKTGRDLISRFKPFKRDDGIEVNRVEDIPRDLTIRYGWRDAGTEAPPHSHEWGQLLYASEGVMQVMAEQSIWVIPPQRAVWIPPGVTHGIRVLHSVMLRNVYVAPQAIRNLPTHCRVMHVSPLLRELIREASSFPALYDEDGPEGRLARVLLDCLTTADETPLQLPVPEKGPIKKIADHLKKHPDDNATLDQWADELGTTSRTLARQFKKQTDMTFGQWRQQARLLEALERLAINQPISHIAQDLGYASQSAFTAMFKKTLGVTPGNYFK